MLKYMVVKFIGVVSIILGVVAVDYSVIKCFFNGSVFVKFMVFTSLLILLSGILLYVLGNKFEDLYLEG